MKGVHYIVTAFSEQLCASQRKEDARAQVRQAVFETFMSSEENVNEIRRLAISGRCINYWKTEEDYLK